MNLALLLPALGTAFFAGLLGSGHCFGMCGGIAAGLGVMGGAGVRQALPSALLFNLGRITSYVALGGLAALVVGMAGTSLEQPQLGRWLRLLTAVLIALVGLQLMTRWRLLDWLERAGAGVWKKISPLAMASAARPGVAARFGMGLCWGFLPCGLVYTMLLTAASTGTAPAGAAVMLTFGLGTLPSMLGMTLAAPALSAFLADAWTRRLVGAALLLLAAWAAWLALLPMQADHH